MNCLFGAHARFLGLVFSEDMFILILSFINMVLLFLAKQTGCKFNRKAPTY